MAATSKGAECADIRLLADGARDLARALDQTRLATGSLGALPSCAVWLSLRDDGVFERATVMLFGDNGARGERSAGGNSLLFTGIPDGLDLDFAPYVAQTTVATPCCKSGLGVVYRDAAGRRALAYAHIKRPRRVRLPVFAPGYRSQLAPAEGLRMGGVTFEPLRPAGVLCVREKTGPVVLWEDASGKPRGWERYAADTFVVPRHAVAGTQILSIGLGPAGPIKTKGFERLAAAESLGKMASVAVFDERVRDF